MKKYFNTRNEAKQAMAQRDPKGFYGLNVYKMKRGTRHAGMYAVCTWTEYLNTY